MRRELIEWYGNRDKRLTVRLNLVQMWGLQLLAEKEDLQASVLARGIIADWLWNQRRGDPEFRKHWDALAARAVRKGEA